MRNLLTIIIILFLFSCDFRTSKDLNNDAQKLEQEGRYKEAIILLNKAIDKDNNNIYALLNRGVDKSILGDYKGAILDYSQVLIIDSDNTLAFLNRGINKGRLEDYKGAIEDFNKSINSKGDESIYIDKIESTFFDTGFEFDVKMEEIRFERGIANYHIDSLYASYKDFNFCIQENFELPESLYHRGLIYIAYNESLKGCNDLFKSRDLNYQYAKESIDIYCNKNKSN